MSDSERRDFFSEDDEEDVVTPNCLEGSESTLGRYKLCFELASGGMATVYLARAEGLSGFERLVALKRIHPHLAKKRRFVEMFLDEARIASRINHPNVCSVFDFGEVNGFYYLTMEFLVGEPLSRVIRALRLRGTEHQRSQSLAVALRVVADLCEGLHAAHELRNERQEPLNVIHRDISPQNLFVTYDGVAKVVDFGIATAREQLHETTTGHIKGKYAYMSPEQAEGGVLDRRTDVWALGVVLWELLTLRPLFRRKSQTETLFAVMSEPIPPPSDVAVGVRLDSALDEIVMRALDRNPDGRYSTARQLGRALLQALAREREPVGLADVSDWLRSLFEEEHARRLHLIRLASALPSDDTIPNVGADVSIPTESTKDTTKTDPSHQLSDWRRWLRRSLIAVSAIGFVVFVSLLVIILRSSGDDTSTPNAETKSLIGRTPVEGPGGASDAAPDTPEHADAEWFEEENGAPSRPRKNRPAHGGSGTTHASKQFGEVSVVSSEGWADVYSRGRHLGQTPQRFKLPLGRHVLEVCHLGKRPCRRIPVVIRAGKTGRVVIKGESR